MLRAKITDDGLTQSGTECFTVVPTATVYDNSGR